MAFLDHDGVTYLWSKIKEYITGLGYITSSGSITGNAATATKATQDGSGNNIANTYATKSSVPTKTSQLTDDTGFVKKNGSVPMTAQLVIGTTSTTVYTGVETIRKTSSAGTRSAGFFVNSDGTSKFVNRDKTSGTDKASFIFNENGMTYVVGSDTSDKKYTVYHSGNLSTALDDYDCGKWD